MSDREVRPWPVDGTLGEVLGFELLEASGEVARARFAVEDRVRQPFGLVHGGAYSAMAETLTSAATHLTVAEDGNFAVGQSNHTTFLRPVTEGTVHVEGRPIHRGRTTWVWDVDFTDDDGRKCAVARVTLAVR